MSVINQMLQELERRQAEGGISAARVRAVPLQGRSHAAWWVLVTVCLLAACAAMAYWMLGRHEGETAPPSLPPAPRPVVAAHAPTPELPQVLQLAGELSQMPAMNARTAPVDPVPTPQVVSPVAPSPSKPPAPAQKAPVSEESSPPAAINKEIRQPSPQQRAEIAYRQAYAGLQQGRMGEAEESLRQALLHDPRHAAARQALAALLVETKHLERAELLLQQGLDIQPGQAGFAMTLARLQVERGDVAAALATLQRHPPTGENADYHGFMAALLQRGDRHKEAIEHYQNALRSNPGSGPWLLGLGISLQADSQPARAAEAFRRAKASGGLSPELQAFADQRLRQLQ